MVYFWTKNGLCFPPRGGKQSRRDGGGAADGRHFGTAGSRGDEGFEAAGCLTRVIGGKIVIGESA
jgi:hypothetical protein